MLAAKNNPRARETKYATRARLASGADFATKVQWWLRLRSLREVVVVVTLLMFFISEFVVGALFGCERICLHFLPKEKRTRNCKKSEREERKGLKRTAEWSTRAGESPTPATTKPHALRERRYGPSFGASEATIFSKRGSPRSGSQNGCRRSSP